SRRGRWLRWNVAKENRPAADLAREGALLGEESATPEPVSDAERSALRARDPGPPAIVDPATHAVIPPRQPGLPATLFDLSAYYNMTITDPDNRDEISVDIPAFAPGTRRLLGVDYDARGMIALDMPALKILRGQAPTRVAGIRPGVPKFAALDVLIGAIGRLKQRKREPYCYVELTYADASKARLPIVYRNDIWESWVNTGDAGTAHVAWSGSSGTPGGAPARLYAVRLANPYPQRSVASVAFESTDVEWSLPALLAITAETGTATSAATPSPPSNH
ncbi:hypothetical protein, partial [Rudaea sp.]|uniref:hypothetical protein n=1 Tax=Rudaea sp. TaxID=2136325 RepID=UPI002ED1C2C0